MRMKQQINLIKDKMGHLVKVIGVCGRVEFLLSVIILFSLHFYVWWSETEYTRLWDLESWHRYIVIFNHSYDITLLWHIGTNIVMCSLIGGNLTFSLFYLSISMGSKYNYLYLLAYVFLYLLYYIQGFRRCRDMGVSPWRMFIPLYMPIALFLVKGKKVDRED